MFEPVESPRDLSKTEEKGGGYRGTLPAKGSSQNNRSKHIFRRTLKMQ